MAKQLYDYWFVQFDFPNEEGKPYKSSGGEMVWDEKLRRDIPKGWSCSDIKSALNIFTGKKDVSKAIPGPYKFFSCAPEPISSNEYMYDGEVVLVSGNGSYTGRVGYFNGKFDLYQRTYACVLKSESDTWMPFYYYTLRYMFQPVFSGGKHGSSIPYIVLGDLADFKFAKELTIINRFVSIVAPMFNEQFKRLVETEQLIKQRNELLPLLMNGQVSVNSDLSVYKKKRRGKIPSLTLNQVSDIQILHRQSIVLLSKQVLMDEFQTECLIILVVITFGTEVFVTIAWHVLLEEASQVFQAFGLVLFEVTAHNDDRPVGEVASSIAVLPKADVAVQIALTDVHTKAIGILHHATTVSVAELLTQVEIEIKNQIFLFHN